MHCGGLNIKLSHQNTVLTTFTSTASLFYTAFCAVSGSEIKAQLEFLCLEFPKLKLHIIFTILIAIYLTPCTFWYFARVFNNSWANEWITSELLFLKISCSFGFWTLCRWQLFFLLHVWVKSELNRDESSDENSDSFPRIGSFEQLVSKNLIQKTYSVTT